MLSQSPMPPPVRPPYPPPERGDIVVTKYFRTTERFEDQEDQQFEVYRPHVVGQTGRYNHPKLCSECVIYLPSTQRETAPECMFTGCECVFCPLVSDKYHGAEGRRWKAPLPHWILRWIKQLVRTFKCWDQSCSFWRLVGYSRGACWGLQLLSKDSTDIPIERFLLVAPYFTGKQRNEHACEPTSASCILNGIQKRMNNHRNMCLIVFGSNDEYLRDALACGFMRVVMALCCHYEIRGAGHDCNFVAWSLFWVPSQVSGADCQDKPPFPGAHRWFLLH